MSKSIIIPKDVFFSKAKDNSVLLNYETGIYYGLDPIGSEYWELIQENASFNSIIEKMLVKYPSIPRETIESDLNELISKLKSNGLVKVF